jgi:Fe-S cluster assembly scaffold protein SufB
MNKESFLFDGEALQKHSDLFKEYFAKLVPAADNKFVLSIARLGQVVLLFIFHPIHTLKDATKLFSD